MLFGFRSSFGIGDTFSLGLIPNGVAFMMMSVDWRVCFKDSEL